jgi:predicted nuclease of predicted toxin-antitoxin system
MKLLLDMNISPDLCAALTVAGWKTVHWSLVGEPTATDAAILDYAKKHSFVVLTHDLDFSAILSATQAKAPSVVQLRIQDVLSEDFKTLLVSNLRKFEPELESGALLVIDEAKSRARILPI